MRTKRGKRVWTCIDCKLVHEPKVAEYLASQPEALLRTLSVWIRAKWALLFLKEKKRNETVLFVSERLHNAHLRGVFSICIPIMTAISEIKDFPHDGKIYRYLSDKRAIMRYIIVLIALMALCGLMPSMWAQQPGATVGLSENAAPLADPAETALTTTPSMASFLSNSWVPPSALNESVNASLNNTTVLDTTAAPIFTASAANKDGVVAWTGESRFQFLQDSWTPSTPVDVIQTTPFKLHQMN